MLSSEQLRSFHRALLDAYSLTDFESLLSSRLGTRLSLLSPPGESMQTQVFDVIQTAERAGWTADLVKAAYEARPRHNGLAEIYGELGLAPQIQRQERGRNVSKSLSGVDESALASRIDVAAWRERLSQLEAQVCRVEVAGTLATGFLVASDIVMTCFYVVEEVVEQKHSPAAVRCRFDYRILPDGLVEPGTAVALEPEGWLYDYSTAGSGAFAANLPTPDELDYALLKLAIPIGLKPRDHSGTARGWIDLPETSPPLLEKSSVMMMSHMDGGALKLIFDAEGIIGVNENGTRVQYALNTAPGSGGAPCFNLEGTLIAIHEGRTGPSGVNQGVPIAAIRQRLERLNKASIFTEITSTRAQLAQANRSVSSTPPQPGPVLHSDDLQKGRWGGLSERDGRKLRIELQDETRGIFYFNAIVESTDKSTLDGPVIFHLHDSYPKSVIWIRKIRSDNSAALEEVSSYGVYTIGVQVKDKHGNWTSLEFDLCDLADLPQRFREQ